MNARLLFLHALSPLHAGTGQGVGVIDLPIARERATNLPFLPGSSVKGTLRDGCADKEMRKKVFGPDTTAEDKHAGSVQFSDQRLLLLPIRSLVGTFAWVTSPYVLRRLLRDAEGIGATGLPTAVPAPEESACVVAETGCQVAMNGRVILEDLELTASRAGLAAEWAAWLGNTLFPNDAEWQEMLAGRFVVVHDDVLSFLVETATEVTARIKLQEHEKTVKDGGLWYEEALPTETVLCGLALATEVKATPEEVFRTLGTLVQRPLQFGGKATVGRGLCRLRMAEGGA